MGITKNIELNKYGKRAQKSFQMKHGLHKYFFSINRCYNRVKVKLQVVNK